MTTENKQNLYSNADNCTRFNSIQFMALADKLSRHKGIVVGVFWDNRFTDWQQPDSFTYDDIVNTWGRIPGVCVVPLNYDQVRSYSLLFKGKMDILVYPYGSIYPMDAMYLYSAQTFIHYLRKGGAILTAGGLPFMQQADSNGKIIPVDTPVQKTEVYDKWVSKFGIKYYELPERPTHEKANISFFPSLCGVEKLGSGQYGFTIVNSSHDPVPKPPHGNVFPERYPARQVTTLISGMDGYGAQISTSAVLVQDYENGSRRVHFSNTGENNLLNPQRTHFESLMNELFALLTNRVFAAEIEPTFVCYRQGETVRLQSEIINCETVDKIVTVMIEIRDCEGLVYEERRNITIQPGLNKATWLWDPKTFYSDEYFVDLLVCNDKQTLSKAYNGFAVWNNDNIGKSSTLGLCDKYFTIDGKGSYITGTNYYESSRGELMWFRPNAANIINDLRAMHDCSINLIRPHYHHLKWFKDYLLYSHEKLLPFFAELTDLKSAMPDERAWRIFDLFIYLSAKYEIIYNGDLFTLVPEEMGDPRGWFGTVEAVYDLDKREAQKIFLHELEKRYAKIPLISWDLFNEPYGIPDEDVNSWAGDLGNVLKDMKSDRLLTVGGPMNLGDAVSYNCPHGMMKDDFVNPSDKPLLLQELHIDYPEPLEMELNQAEVLRRCTITSIRSGLAGICPWSWTRQQRLWQDVYEHHHSFPMEKWDDRLGIHMHEDGTLKAAGLYFKDFSILMRNIDFLSYSKEKLCSKTSLGIVIARISEEGDHNVYSLQHVNDSSCFCAMQHSRITWDDKTLAKSDNDAYVYFYTTEGDFFECNSLYIKVDRPGRLFIYRGKAKSAMLVDCLPKADKKLADISYASEDELCWLDFSNDMCRYWVKLIY